MKSTSNHSEQRLFREEVLSFMQESTSNRSEQRLFREEVLSFMRKNAGVFHVIDGEYRQVHYFKWRLE